MTQISERSLSLVAENGKEWRGKEGGIRMERKKGERDGKREGRRDVSNGSEGGQ